MALSPTGREEGLRLLRGHRLWESYQSELGLPEDHTHGPADAAAHCPRRRPGVTFAAIA